MSAAFLLKVLPARAARAPFSFATVLVGGGSVAALGICCFASLLSGGAIFGSLGGLLQPSTTTPSPLPGPAHELGSVVRELRELRADVRAASAPSYEPRCPPCPSCPPAPACEPEVRFRLWPRLSSDFLWGFASAVGLLASLRFLYEVYAELRALRHAVAEVGRRRAIAGEPLRLTR